MHTYDLIAKIIKSLNSLDRRKACLPLPNRPRKYNELTLLPFLLFFRSILYFKLMCTKFLSFRSSCRETLLNLLFAQLDRMCRIYILLYHDTLHLHCAQRSILIVFLNNTIHSESRIHCFHSIRVYNLENVRPSIKYCLSKHLNFSNLIL